MSELAEGEKGRTVWEKATERPPLTEYEHIIYSSYRDGIAHVTMLRPSFNREMKEELAHALWERYKYANEDRALIITGPETTLFSGGEDIFEINPDWDQQTMRRYAEQTLDLYHDIIKGVMLVDKPVIAALNGTVAGSGLSMAIACDERFAVCTSSEKNYHYILKPGFCQLGLVPDCGITETLPNLIGSEQANRWLEPSLVGVSFEVKISEAQISHPNFFRRIFFTHDDMFKELHGIVAECVLKRSPTEYAAMKQRRNHELVERLTRRYGVFQWEKDCQASCLMSEYTRDKIREFQQAKANKEAKANA